MKRLNPKPGKLLSLTKAEQSGAAALLLITAAVLLYPLLKPQAEAGSTALHLEQFKRQVDSFENSLSRRQQAPQLFAFNPNTVDSIGLLTLGFTPRQAQSVQLYRAKGGRFTKVSDFKKLYVVTPGKYEQLKPYIRLEGSAPSAPLELNSASAHQLQQLGLSRQLAEQLTYYRRKLGGFYSLEQLAELSGVDAKALATLKQQKLNTKQVAKLAVNSADELKLRQHPYIGIAASNAIVKLRRQQKISSSQQLVSKQILSAEQAAKLQAYLSFE